MSPARQIRFKDILEGITVHEEVDEVTDLSRLIIVDSPDEKKQPAVEIKGKDGKVNRKYHMPSHAHLMVQDARRTIIIVPDEPGAEPREYSLPREDAKVVARSPSVGRFYAGSTGAAHMPFNSRRRTFLAQLTGLASIGGVAAAAQSADSGRRQQNPSVPEKWDTAWLDSFKGKHKQLYDLMWHTLRPNTLNPPTFYLDVHHDVSGLEFPDVNVVIGVNTSFALNASDALWEKYSLGERSDVKDPATGKPALRNVYLGTGKGDTRSSIRSLQARGAVFIQCNVALQGAINGLAREFGKPQADVDAEVRAGLNPGVKIVPALTWAVGMLQERGFTYEKL